MSKVAFYFFDFLKSIILLGVGVFLGAYVYEHIEITESRNADAERYRNDLYYNPWKSGNRRNVAKYGREETE